MSLQKFKLLATRCAASGNPTQSPTTSPVVHLRRRKTLRMLLSRSGNGCGGGGDRRFEQRRGGNEESSDRKRTDDRSTVKVKQQKLLEPRQMSVRQKLKDLLISSPPALGVGDHNGGKKRIVDEEEARGLLPATDGKGCGLEMRRGAGSAGSLRPLSATLRQRLLRRAWRPVLIAIPEVSP
ncbi:hypothetical protein Dimus_034052 [Dionaea muscipula]